MIRVIITVSPPTRRLPYWHGCHGSTDHSNLEVPGVPVLRLSRGPSRAASGQALRGTVTAS
eukprot:1031095-Rhodomonas_salina.3